MAELGDKGFSPEVWAQETVERMKEAFFYSYRRKTLGEKLLRAAAEGSTSEQLKTIEERHNAPFSFTEEAAQALANQLDRDILDSIRYQSMALADNCKRR